MERKTLDLRGVAHELRFWKEFVQSDRFLKGWVPDNIITPELREEVNFMIRDADDAADKEFRHKDFKVLDVGSGVVSILNGTIHPHHLMALDPLGELYELIFDYKAHGIAPPIALSGEDMQFIEQFDVVHMSNALDHSYDPFLVYQNLIRAVKPGGLLIIQGFGNEGSYEKWEGFHQWNIDIEPGTGFLVASDKAGKYSTISEEGNGKQYKFKLDTAKDWFIWTQRKVKK